MIPVEVMSMVGGAVGGFVMKMAAQRAQDEKDRFDRMMQSIDKSDQSADRAAARDNTPHGQWIRRVIVLAVLFGVILGPFILAIFNKPVTVQVDTPVKTWLFGLISSGGNPVFYEIQSYLLIPEIRQALLCIIAFYFGQAAAKRNQ